MSDRGDAINERQAYEFVSGIQNPIVRELGRFALAEARVRFMPTAAGDSDRSIGSRPDADFDMLFFAEVVVGIVAQTDIIQRLLSGESLSQAAGWDP